MFTFKYTADKLTQGSLRAINFRSASSPEQQNNTPQLYGGFVPDTPLFDLSFVLGEVMNSHRE